MGSTNQRTAVIQAEGEQMLRLFLSLFVSKAVGEALGAQVVLFRLVKAATRVQPAERVCPKRRTK
jgi:hypothetical protein